MDIIKQIAEELQIKTSQAETAVRLIDEGNTIPFIARYRKEATGSLDEVQVSEIKSLNDKFIELEKRKKTVLSSIEEQERLTPELQERIENCWDDSDKA